MGAVYGGYSVGVRKFWVGLALVVAGGSLVSCGGMESVVPSGINADDETETRRADETAAGTDSTRSAPRGFQFEGGFLEFGEFDPYALGDDIFNPCTEITEEEFAAAGFEQMRYDEEDKLFSRGIEICHFGELRSDGSGGGFYGGEINKPMVAEIGLELPQYTSDIIPNLYALKANSGIEGTCYTQIDTTRGSFGTHAGGSPRRVSQDEACAMAIDYAERLFIAYGVR